MDETSQQGDRRMATVAEAKALGNAIRLRILRLCLELPRTNQELSERLDRDPSTILRHVKQLVDTGFLAADEVRTGESGAMERPYRATRLSWQIDLGPTDVDGGVPMLDAFLEEFAEAGPTSVAFLSRFSLHLTDEEREEMTGRVQAILDEYVGNDDVRRDAGSPPVSGMAILHRTRPG